MEDLYMELFKTMNQFRKLHMADMMPEQLNQGDFFTLNHIMDAEDGKITISKLARKTKVLPSAISRTLRGLEACGTDGGSGRSAQYLCDADRDGARGHTGVSADHAGFRQGCYEPSRRKRHEAADWLSERNLQHLKDRN
jgi:hypothetical protein